MKRVTQRINELAGTLPPRDLITEGANINLRDALDGYLEAVLFGETDEEGEPLDRDHDVSDIDRKSVGTAKRELTKFIGKAKKIIDQIEDLDDTQFGMDFYFSRAGHGVGFWSREEIYGDFGDELHSLAQKFGEIYAYVGDDGQVYID